MNAPGVPLKSSDGSAKAWLPAAASGWFWPLTPLVSGGCWSCAAAALAITNAAVATTLNRMFSPFGRGRDDATEPLSRERLNDRGGHDRNVCEHGHLCVPLRGPAPQRLRRIRARKSCANPAGAVASGQRGEPSGGRSRASTRESNGKRRRTSASGAAKTSQEAKRRSRHRSV